MVVLDTVYKPYFDGEEIKTELEPDPTITSEIIAKRLRRAEHRFFSSDNISDYLIDGELALLEKEATERFKDVLRSLVIDIDNDPNSQNTAHRLAKMFIRELFEGRYKARPNVTSFPNEGTDQYTGMLVVRAEIKSICAHHWQNVLGTAFIGIIPNGRVIGLSKYIRLAQWCARRGTLQEELTMQIATEIKKATNSNDVGVHIRAEHGCVICRGVEAHSALTQTTVLSGKFEELHVKNEFFQNILMQNK